MASTLDHFFAHCPEPLFVADRDGALLRVSAPLRRLLGSEVREGTKLSSRVHPDDRATFEAAWPRLAELTAPLVQLDSRVLGADGVYAARSWRLQGSPGGGEVHGSLREGGMERAQATAKLEQEAALIRLIQENLPVGIWAIDTQGTFTRHEGKALTQLGLEQGQFVGMNIFEAFVGNPFLDLVRRALAGKLTHGVLADSSGHWNSWFLPVCDPAGEVVSVVGVGLDVTEVKEVENKLREKLALIERQQQVINALSTPIIEVWDRVLTLPMLGVIDSARSAAVMENLLTEVSRKGARFAILDLTGVETMDTSTAAHLLRLIQAIRLLGAEGIITGIQPSVAQTMVTLGLDLGQITTLATLRDGLRFCMRLSEDELQVQQGSGRPSRR